MKVSSYPHLVNEWHPTKNGELTPDDFSHGTRKKVWWLCPKGHSYFSGVIHRARNNTNCPYCAGKKVSPENSLVSLFPEVAKEWHPTKNGDLKPSEITFGSSKKVWWLCSNNHSYAATAGHRTTMNTGCPYCSGRKASKSNNLSILFPDTAKEWHPSKNGDLTPKEFTSGTNKKVWWLCPSGHSYESSIGRRTSYKTGCPYCAGKKASEENNLPQLFPDIAKEWHPTKNKDLNPSQFTRGSSKKAWWLCPNDHSYEAKIYSRTGNSTGCPYCTKQTSQPEIRILSELKWVFKEVNSRYKINKNEIDIFVPKFNLGIEYDGSYWHKDSEKKDLKKNKFLLSRGINLIRVRHQPLELTSHNDLIVNNEVLSKNDLNALFTKIKSFVDNQIIDKIDLYLTKSSFVNEELFKEYLSYFPSPFPENSLLNNHPQISKEWDYDKNKLLTPENFSPSSHNKVWWICPKGHSYESLIYQRTGKKPTGCPYCAGKKVSDENNLANLFPKIAKDWHPTKNGELTPQNVTYGSHKKVWWLCSKGHSYINTMNGRTGPTKMGCPYCSGRRVSKDNNLLALFPNIAKEWHHTMNDALKPEEVTFGSSKKIWWLCSKGHSFNTSVNRRTSLKTNCPYCAGQKASEDNNLSILFPEIAREWHPTKNGELKPENFTRGSNKKIWWVCPKGHSFESIIKSRTRKSGKKCPYCKRNKSLNLDLF